MVDPALNILLVDDDSVDVKTMKKGLVALKRPYRLHTASDGIEALGILRGTNDKPPLAKPFMIFLDLNLPGMRGSEFLEALRSDNTLCGSIVFILTSSNRYQDRRESYRYNVAGYILKRDKCDDMKVIATLLDSYTEIVQFPP